MLSNQPDDSPVRQSSDEHRLVQLITDALTLADALGQSSTALYLNDALSELSESGVVPPGWAAIEDDQQQDPT